MANINFGILDTQSPAKIGNAFIRSPEQQNANMLQAMQMQQLMDQREQAQYALGKSRREETGLAAFGEGLRALGPDPDPDAVAQLFIKHPDRAMQQAGVEMLQKSRAEKGYGALGPMGGATAARPAVAPTPAPAPGSFAENMLANRAALSTLGENQLPAAVAAPTAPTATRENLIAQIETRLRAIGPFVGRIPQAKAESDRLDKQLENLRKAQNVVPGGTLITAGLPDFIAPAAPSEFEKLLKDSGLSQEEQRAARVAKVGKDSTTISEFSNVLAQLGRTKDPSERQQLQNRLTYLSTHAPGTSLTVKLPAIEGKYGAKFGELAAEDDRTLLGAARSAPKIAENANETLRLLELPTITGSGADIRLALAKAYNLLGDTDQQSIVNTENLIKSTGEATLAAIKNSGLGTGQGFTNNDLKFLQGVAGGTIALQAESIARFARVQHAAAVKIAAMWEARKKNIPRSALEGTGIDKESISIEFFFCWCLIFLR
jgi:hypothetical protein